MESSHSQPDCPLTHLSILFPVRNLDLEHPHAKIVLEQADARIQFISTHNHEADKLRFPCEIEFSAAEVQA